MQLGTILLILTIITGLVIILVSPFMKKISKNYYLWLFLGLFVFLYVFFGRQIQYLMPTYTNVISSESLMLSRLLLLDLCPFYAIFGSLSLLLKNKTTAKIMAPFGLFGAMVTIFGQIIHEANDVLINNYWNYIFVGINPNQLYFMMHYLSFALSLMIICWMRNWNIKILGYMHIFALAYFGYVLIIVSVCPQITSNTTGILENDWINGGEYVGVGIFLGISTYPLVMFVGYLLSYISIVLIYFIRFLIEKVFIKLNKKYDFVVIKNKFLSKFKIKNISNS
ncbi:DUF5378 family protein [Mycoplasmoides pirum]|uniref:DUF5378 family protein n=1 Tax=Mycoplasmoides pirum TaxID=2122 RepID=UPI0004848BFC|nr:DUF5378 family protein [Mycoplasmoides pirum]